MLHDYIERHRIQFGDLLSSSSDEYDSSSDSRSFEGERRNAVSRSVSFVESGNSNLDYSNASTSSQPQNSSRLASSVAAAAARVESRTYDRLQASETIRSGHTYIVPTKPKPSRVRRIARNQSPPPAPPATSSLSAMLSHSARYRSVLEDVYSLNDEEQGDFVESYHGEEGKLGRKFNGLTGGGYGEEEEEEEDSDLKQAIAVSDGVLDAVTAELSSVSVALRAKSAAIAAREAAVAQREADLDAAASHMEEAVSAAVEARVAAAEAELEKQYSKMLNQASSKLKKERKVAAKAKKTASSSTADKKALSNAAKKAAAAADRARGDLAAAHARLARVQHRAELISAKQARLESDLLVAVQRTLNHGGDVLRVIKGVFAKDMATIMDESRVSANGGGDASGPGDTSQSHNKPAKVPITPERDGKKTSGGGARAKGKSKESAGSTDVVDVKDWLALLYAVTPGARRPSDSAVLSSLTRVLASCSTPRLLPVVWEILTTCSVVSSTALKRLISAIRSIPTGDSADSSMWAALISLKYASDEPGILLSALNALRDDLVADEGLPGRFIGSGGVPLLIPLLSSPLRSVLLPVTDILVSLLGSDSGSLWKTAARAALDSPGESVFAGASSALNRPSLDEHVQDNLALILQRLSRIPETASSFLHTPGLMEALREAASGSEGSFVAMNARSVLSNISNS